VSIGEFSASFVASFAVIAACFNIAGFLLTNSPSVSNQLLDAVRGKER
jgi:hypothetical protein